ncbi:MAG: tetraacyldisaccharide 4'-kinase [Chitinophagaceae bacterium]
MHFTSFFLRSFRLLLLPISILYGIILKIRNKLYDSGKLYSTTFNLPIINVGNLSVGGTGKSPMVEYLIKMLKDSFHLATLSRGYKRRTKGYVLANESSTALEIGDEPMQFHILHPEVAVSVGEARIEVIPQLLYDRPETNVILLDDAFQHRSLKAGLNILLTDFNNLYTRDFYLPTGDLRDNIKSADRAEIIVVTKCPPRMTVGEKEKIIDELAPLLNQNLFFSCIRYGKPYHICTYEKRELEMYSDVLLVCGIANPDPLNRYIHQKVNIYEGLYFKDHHIYTIDDLNEILVKFNKMQGVDKFIITTEKDAVRLMKFKKELMNVPFYVLPISMEFLFEDEMKFRELITNFIKRFPERAN